MSFEQFPLSHSDPEAIERFPHKMSADIADTIAKGFAQLEEHIGATEARLCARLAELEDRLAQKH